ncbi:MAG TPA: hypothetical protein VFV33_06890, partial [Gemmatimonadaceae bacterium]|nr:hypothetical protein [Gemmatimonadaceae bacterium]
MTAGAQGSPRQPHVSLAAAALRLSLDARGTLSELRDAASGRNLLAPDTVAALLTVVRDGRRIPPTALSSRPTAEGMELTLRYAPVGARIVVRARPRATHLTLDITSAAPADRIDAVVWGPFPSSISQTVGEVVGIVRDSA